MKSNVDRMIDHLTPTINQKCRELKATQKERMLSRVFVLLCAMVILVPALLIFAGISLTMLIVPLVFMSLSILLLLPILLSGKTPDQGGTAYEHA